jgi:hypothetical protein
MHQAVVPFTGVLLLAATACGQGTQDGGVPARGAAAHGFLGSVTYHYDPELLTAASVRVAVPARDDENTYAIKLIAARTVEGSPDMCPGGAETCPIELQPGLTLALLERPFERYEQALRSSDLAGDIAPTTVGGTEGITIDGGTEGGLEVEYRLVPVDNRALLIKLQRGGESPAEEAALEEVIENLDLGD